MSKRILSKMGKDWDARAREDAVGYIGREEKDWDENGLLEWGGKQAYDLTSEFFLRKVFNPAGKRMLDIGCGIGHMERGFLEMFGEVWGSDVSGEMISKAVALNESKNVKFVRSNGKDLSNFSDNFFDFVFSYRTLQHIPEKRIIFSYFSEIYRTLKPGGLFKIQLAIDSGIAFMFGFIPVPRILFPFIPEWAWRVYKYKRLRFIRGKKYDLAKGRTWRGTVVGRSAVQNQLHSLKFVEIEILEDPKNKKCWCCGRKPS